MTVFTFFFYVDAGTSRTHILAWNPNPREWVIPCNMIERPHRDRVTYAPTKPLCQTCSKLTWQPSESDVPRTRNR